MTYWPFISNAGQYSLVTASILLAGCATRPLPQDVTQLETVQIVNRIRCETKNALQDQIISYLSTESAESNSIAKQLRADPKQFVDFDRSRLSAEALRTINLYDGTAVAYDFSFDITEKNSLDTEFGVQKKGSTGLFTGGLLGKNELRRRNLRNFQITDSFEKLLNGSLECRPTQIARSQNFYPITGTIGMAEMLQTFFALNETKSLTAKKELGEKVAYLSDTVEFQTINSVTVDPLGVVDPVLHSLRIERVSASAVASRDDIHKVIISIALPPDAPQTPVLKPSENTVRSNKDPRPSSKRTLGEEKALDQIENQILRDRTVISPTTLRELQNLQ